ncbi:pirin family protein [Flavobacteriaceae bacterium M23B6Z8]
MSNTGIIIAERSRDIGDFLVGRLLPFRKKRMVGPFVFIDHMGPTEITTNYLDIGQHPHIGLSTLTYLFEGEIMHRDSIGSLQKITPGSVNFMTAGKGVVHTERTPSELRNGGSHTVHGFQIWIALPKEKEDMEPTFQHVNATDLPIWKNDGIQFKLIAGKAYHTESPLTVFSDLFLLELKAEENTQLDLRGKVSGEIGICVVDGSITACNEDIAAGNLLVTKEKDQCKLNIHKDTHLLIFGGKPFEEERHIFWNFVSSERDKIEKAKTRWKSGKFKMIPEEKGFIKMPE